MIGWYGKIPGSGDFIARRLPASFRDPWDRWLQSAMAGSRERLGAAWHDAYLSMPAWRFALAPGVVSAGAWAGLMVPSVDSVGRCFPLTMAAALPPAPLDAAATVRAAAGWLDALEAIALSALEPRTGAAAIDAALLQQPPFRADGRQAPGKGQACWIAPESSETRAAWLADEHLALSRDLPEPQQYCALIDGRWPEHGWKARPRA